MSTVRITAKLVILLLSCCAFIYLATACSTGKHLMAFSNVWRLDGTKSGMTDEDLSKWLSQLKSHPGNAEAHHRLGCWYLDRSRYEEAIKEFKKAIYIKPNYVEAYNGLGVCCDRQGDYVAASDAYRMALKLNPNLAYVYNNLGHSYTLQGKSNKAIDALKQAIALGSNSERTHNNLGLAYAYSGQFDLAMKEFEMTGNNALAHTLVAKVYYRKGQFEKAKKHYEEALALDPDSAPLQQSLETSTLIAKFEAVLAPLKQAIEAAAPLEPAQVQTTQAAQASQVQPVQVEKKAAVQTPGDALRSFSGVGLEISNGNGVRDMAKNTARYLGEKGFKILRLTNANHFKHAKTMLLYKPECRDATQELAKQLPDIPTMQEVEKLDRPNIRIKIVLGRDLASHRTVFQKEQK